MHQQYIIMCFYVSHLKLTNQFTMPRSILVVVHKYFVQCSFS